MRLKLPLYLKLALWALALFLLWQAFQSNVILEPIFMFLTTGQVPGTGIRLAPDTVLNALPFVFTGIVVLILHRELWRIGRWIVRIIRRQPATVHMTEPEGIEDEMTEEDAAEPKPKPAMATEVTALEPPRKPSALRLKVTGAAITAKLTARQTVKQFHPAVIRLRTYLRKHGHRLLIRCIPYLDRAAYHAGYAVGWLKYCSLRSWAEIKKASRLIWKIVRIEMRNVTRFSVRQARAFWRWLSPYLWQFDAWLGRQINIFLKSPQARHARHVVREYRNEISRRLKK